MTGSDRATRHGEESERRKRRLVPLWWSNRSKLTQSLIAVPLIATVGLGASTAIGTWAVNNHFKSQVAPTVTVKGPADLASACIATAPGSASGTIAIDTAGDASVQFTNACSYGIEIDTLTLLPLPTSATLIGYGGAYAQLKDSGNPQSSCASYDASVAGDSSGYVASDIYWSGQQSAGQWGKTATLATPIVIPAHGEATVTFSGEVVVGHGMPTACAQAGSNGFTLSMPNFLYLGGVTTDAAGTPDNTTDTWS